MGDSNSAPSWEIVPSFLPVSALLSIISISFLFVPQLQKHKDEDLSSLVQVNIILTIVGFCFFPVQERPP